MPALHKRKGSPYWIVAYTDPKGRRLKKSTKTKDFAVAKQFADDLEKAARARREALQERNQRQRVFSELYEDTKPPVEASQSARIAPDNIPNQREIASILGISQTAVSMALRGDRRISAEIRQKVQEAARRLGYHSNAYVNVLMSRIRSGRKFSDKGIIAMLVDSPSQEAWHRIGSYRLFHQGILRRGEELGFRVETFFLPAETDATKMDRTLYSRGIQGLIFAPPYRGNRMLNLHWNRYAAVGVGFGWEDQDLDRVAFHSESNYIIAFNALVALGYRRIGTPTHNIFVSHPYQGIKWFTGYLECQSRIPRMDRIPLCRCPFDPYPDGVAVLQKWYEKWCPDALVTINGHEHEWLTAMGLRIPKDVGLACLGSPWNPELADFARIDEKAEEVGATALELVASKIARNEYGLPKHPKITMIEGVWTHGGTVRKSGSLSSGERLL